MSDSKRILIPIIVILSILVILLILKTDSGEEFKRAYTSSEGDRYYYDTDSVALINEEETISHVEMKVYPSPGSKEFDSVKKIVKDVIQSGKNKLITSDISEDYLYKDIQAKIDCSKGKIKFQHTDYIAVEDEYIWSDIHEPEKWQDIDTAPMKAIKEAVCK